MDLTKGVRTFPGGGIFSRVGELESVGLGHSSASGGLETRSMGREPIGED